MEWFHQLDKQPRADEVRGLTLDRLGFDAPSRVLIRRLAALGHGKLLFTGPTGSGKTTTLYVAISESSRGSDKIITSEDPAKSELPGVLQVPVDERKVPGLCMRPALHLAARPRPRDGGRNPRP